MDLRMIQFLEMHSWKLVQKYKNETVVIPGHPGSDVELVKYFQVVKKPGEPFYSENQEDNEIGLTLWFGWPGYDHEVEVNLFIRGKDVTGSRNVVSAEILKCGGAPMSVSYRGKVLTDFKKNTWVVLFFAGRWCNNHADNPSVIITQLLQKPLIISPTTFHFTPAF